MSHQRREIVFYEKGIVVGQCELPDFTDEKQRYELAKDIKVDIYDQYQLLTNGVVQIDTAKLKSTKELQDFYDDNSIAIKLRSA